MIYPVGYSETLTWLERLSLTIRWSNIRAVGGLPLMRAVMFAPIVAYLILFNDNAIAFLAQIAANISTPSANAPQSPIDLYFIYYGLLSVGVASVLYTLFAPSSVRRFEDAMQFSKEVAHTGSRTTQLGFFNEILGRYVEEVKSQESGYSKRPLQYPWYLESAASTLVVEVFKKYVELDQKAGENLPADKEHEETGWDSFLAEFYTGSGYPNPEVIAERAYAAPKIIWAYSEPYLAAGLDHFPADIATGKYGLDDNSRPALRFIVALLYALGFALLVIPSARAFATITLGVLLPAPL